MKQKSKAYKNFIMFLAKCYVFFKVVRSKPKYMAAFGSMFAGCVVVIALLVVLINHVSNNGAETVYQSLREDYIAGDKDTRTPDEKAEDDRWSKAVYSMEKDADEAMWYGDIYVDLDGLKQVGPDIVGWIYFEAADISYPVLYSGDNLKYLRATYDGKYETAGSIILEGMNSPDFSDKHTIIYGHNMPDKTMFGQLSLYKTDTDYYDNHQYFQVIYQNDEGEMVKDRYHIFACKDVAVSDDVYQVFSENFDGIDYFAETLKTGNLLKGVDDVEIDKTSQVITLSTCSTENDRFVVCAVKCGECVVK